MQNETINPKALTNEQCVLLLKKLGSQTASIDHLRADIRAGAPTNTNGTINIAHYCAWLVKEHSHAP